jgi:anthranilate phosphoribosyltransferase
VTKAHPFARFVRIIGRGPSLSRALDAPEAEAAMAMILAGAATPEQIGAFLIVLRYRGETPDELAGFVRAGRAHIVRPQPAPAVDLDWPSYADRHRQLPWFTLAALLLAENGVRVLMHGIRGESEGYAPTPAALAGLGIRPCATLAQAAARLDDGGFVYVTLDKFCPPLDALFALRPVLGVRSAVNSFARQLNPLGAPAQIQGVFHPNYRASHGKAAALLGQPRAAIFKGGGGEAQRNPDKPCRVAVVEGDRMREMVWPAMLSGAAYAWRDETAAIERLPALWRGAWHAAAPEAAVIGSAAMALHLLGRAADAAEATALAGEMWERRSRERFDAAAAETG